MTDPTLTDRILRQGKALVRAVEALSTIAPSGPVERAAARLLLAAHKRRMRGVVEAATVGCRGDLSDSGGHRGQAGGFVDE